MLFKRGCVYFNSNEIKKLYSFFINQKIDEEISFQEFIEICSHGRSVYINRDNLPSWVRSAFFKNDEYYNLLMGDLHGNIN